MKKIMIIMMLLVPAGCRDSVPEPESVVASVLPKQSIKVNEDSFTVRHIVQKQNLYIECMLKDISFSGKNGKKVGKVVVSVNGKKQGEFNTAAFVVKNLPKGNHHIQLEVMTLNNEPLLQKQFFVWIT
ncbi:hypothetical protein WAK64_03050 [Bacillus spongiae]|uniref:Lipoprotein n=1 Tax=Bacillus spongiae TaxID=2683610 RepID=A0ABU8H9T3_9BACI